METQLPFLRQIYFKVHAELMFLFVFVAIAHCIDISECVVDLPVIPLIVKKTKKLPLICRSAKGKLKSKKCPVEKFLLIKE